MSKGTRLKFLADVQVSNVDKKSADGEVPVRLCNYTDVYYRHRITADIPFMEATAPRAQVERFRLQIGQTLITKDSETADDIGMPAYVDFEADNLVCGYHLAQITPGLGLDPRFLYWYLSADHTRSALSIEASGVTRFGLRTETVENLRLTLPALDKQRRIAAFLDAETERLDRLIATKRSMVGRSTELRRSVTYEAVAGALFRSDGEVKDSAIPWLRSVPAHWREASLRLVAELGSGHTPSRSHPEWWIDCTVPWVTTGEVARLRSDRHEFIYETREKVSELGLANSSAVVRPTGTVVLCRTSASAGYSGIMAEDMATSQDFATWTCGPMIRPRFLLLCLRAMRRDLLERLGQGSTHVTIYMPDIESIRVPLPPIEEQDQVVVEAWRRMDALAEAEDVLREQITLLEARRCSLITAAVTGEMEAA